MPCYVDNLSAKRFGLKRSPPPFLFLRKLKCHCKKHPFKGVNFASGGSGLLDITGSKPVSPSSQSIAYQLIICITSLRVNIVVLLWEDLVRIFTLWYYCLHVCFPCLPIDGCPLIRADRSICFSTWWFRCYHGSSCNWSNTLQVFVLHQYREQWHFRLFQDQT